MYTIRCNYESGDSFDTYPNQEGEVEISWSTVQKAKENLKRIQEHYEQYKRLNNRWDREKKTNQEIIQESIDKDWLVKKLVHIATHKEKEKTYRFIITKETIEKEKSGGAIITEEPDEMTAEHQIILYTDNNKPFQFWCPWCGYFESLNWVEIVTVNNVNSDTKVYF